MQRGWDMTTNEGSDVDAHVRILLLGLHLRDRIDVVLVSDLVHTLPQRDHTGLHADSLEHGASELVRAARQLGPVDAVVDRHLARVDAEDLRARLLVGQGELDLAVQTARTEQGRVEDVDTVRGREHLHAVVRGETVQLIEELQHGSLHLTVTGLLRVKTLGADGIQLVDEDDRWCLLLGQGEAVPDQFGTVADEHLDELWTSEFEEGGVGLGGTGTSKEGLASTGRSVHQGTW